eukprot:gene10837-22615_t
MEAFFWIILFLLFTVSVQSFQDYKSRCQLRLFSQPTDHFSFSSQVFFFNQRLFVCGEFYVTGGPLLFYTGNESPVDVYLENTGFMWENGNSLNGLIVFAEHRYYGESQLFDSDNCSSEDLKYLSGTQAMADYASIISTIRAEYSTIGTITIGGSYGGMLAAWMRLKYPYLVDGAIASSAPVFSFYGMDPPVDDYSYNRQMAKSAGELCTNGIKTATQQILKLGKSKGGRYLLSKLFKTCTYITTEVEVLEQFISWLQDPWGYLTMGNYPFPSSYMVDAFPSPDSNADIAKLPSWPLRVACKPIEDTMMIINKNTNTKNHNKDVEFDTSLLEALSDAVSVWYNVTKDVQCYFNNNNNKNNNIKSSLSNHKPLNKITNYKAQNKHSFERQQIQNVAYNCGNWDFQYCAEFLMPFSGGSDEDYIYPPTVFNFTETSLQCKENWDIKPIQGYAIQEYGNYNTYKYSSNIFFANGDLDPWMPLGIDCGAHHLDLMFSTEFDPESVREVRRSQLMYMKKWIAQAQAQAVQN